jgi:hypothetical protein
MLESYCKFFVTMRKNAHAQSYYLLGCDVGYSDSAAISEKRTGSIPENIFQNSHRRENFKPKTLSVWLKTLTTYMAVRPDVGTIAVPSPALYRGNQII